MRSGPLPAFGFALGMLTAAGVPGSICARPGDAGAMSEAAEPGVVGARPRILGAEREVVPMARGVAGAEPNPVPAKADSVLGVARERMAPGGGSGEECAPPTVTLRGAWIDPTGHEWASRARLAATGAEIGVEIGAETAAATSPAAAGSAFETLGRIEVSYVSSIRTRSATSCRAGRCLVCPPEVEGVFGYEFHRILLARDLRGAECHRRAAFDHEMRHADLYAEAERRFLPQLRERLRARLAALTPVRTARADTEAVLARWQEALEEEMSGAAERMNRETDARQALLDTEDAYRRWSAETEARCGPFPASAPGRR